MINSFTIKSSALTRGDSLVPEYYYYNSVIKNKNIEKGVSYLKLEKYRISDGEHSAIPRVNESGVRYLYGRNIREACIDFDPISDIPYIDKEDYLNVTRTHISENDVLVPIVGTIGKSAIYKSAYVGLAGIPRHIASISIPEKSEITPEYLSVFLRSKYGKIQLNSLTTGNIQPLLSLSNLKSVDVPIIPSDLMDAITKNESKCNDLLVESTKKINEAKNLLYNSLGFDIKNIKGDFSFEIKASELFSCDIWTPNHFNKLFDNVEKEIVKQLKTVKLKEVTNSFHGVEVGSKNYNEYLNKSKDDKPFIRTSDLVNFEVDNYPDFYVSSSIANEIDKVPVEGDVLFTKDGKIGATGMVTKNDNCIVSSGVQVFRINKVGRELGLTNEYLFIVLSTKELGYYEAIKRTVVASTIPHLRPERMRDIPIPLMEKSIIDEISALIKEAFCLKDQRKPLLRENDILLESFFKERFQNN